MLSFVKEQTQVAEKCSYKMCSNLHKQKEGNKEKSLSCVHVWVSRLLCEQGKQYGQISTGFLVMVEARYEN